MCLPKGNYVNWEMMSIDVIRIGWGYHIFRQTHCCCFQHTCVFTRFIVHVFQHFQLAMMKPDFPEMFEMRVSTKKPVFVCRQHIVIVACISIDNAPIVVHGMRHDLQMNIPL